MAMKTLYKSFMFLLVCMAAACTENEIDYQHTAPFPTDEIPVMQKVLVWDAEEELYSDEAQARIGSQIRIEGNFLDRADMAFFNGMAVFSSEFVSQRKTFIETFIPESTPVGKDLSDEFVRNTVRVASSEGEGDTLSLNIISKNLSVAGVYVFDENDVLVKADVVSAGDRIQIQGTGLDHVADVWINGLLLAEIETVSSAAVNLDVPENILVGANVEYEDDRNTIRMETEFRETIEYSVTIVGKQPVAEDVNFNGVRPGDEVTLKGNNLEAAETLVLKIGDGDAVAVDAVPNADGTELTFTIPETATSGEATVTLTLEGLEAVEWTFSVWGEQPTVDRVSHTLAKAGERIRIYGSHFKNVAKVVFPGNVEAATVVADEVSLDSKGEIWIHSDDNYEMIDVIVPEGGDRTAGALYVEAEKGNGGYSYAYMNCKDNVFISEFNGANDAYSYGSGNISQNNALTPANAAAAPWPAAPEKYRAFPNNAGGIDFTGGTASISGDFNFTFSLVEMMEKAPADVVSCDDLAIQFDCFMEHDGGQTTWVAGAMRFGLGTSDRDIQSTPWHSAYGQPYADVDADFSNGWKTLTFPLKDYANTQGKTTSDFTDTGNNRFFRFAFGSFTYPATGANNYEAGSDMKGFFIYFGNFRIVPYTKPDVAAEAE